jgi:hypothetical protein
MLKMTPENQARAAAGSQAVESYRNAKRNAQGWLDQSVEETLIDLLSDLRHFAEAWGIDFDAADHTAKDHYYFESW